MSYQVAVFDLDGTLLNTLGDLTAAVNHAMSLHGFPHRSEAEVCSFIGDGVAMLIRRAAPAGTDEETLAAALAAFKAHYAAHNCEKTEPYPGILALLDALRARGVRVAVASNKFDAATKKLCAHYLGDRVEAAVGECTEAGIRRKPAPDSLHEALRLLGEAPAHAVYIGDSDTDIETAKNAGIPCLSVTWGFRTAAFLRSHGATTLTDDPAFILKFVTED